MGWAKQQENNLRASKRYLKSDFKVGVTRATPTPLYVTRPKSLSCVFNMASMVIHYQLSALKKHPLTPASNFIETPLNSIFLLFFFFVQLALFKYLSVSWFYCPALKG